MHRSRWLVALAASFQVAAVAPVCARDAPARELLDAEPPSWVQHPERREGESDASPCAGVRAARIDELAPPWRDVVAEVTLQCEVVDGLFGTPSARVDLRVRFKPGAATLGGQPLLQLRRFESDFGQTGQYLIDRPYAQAREPLRRMIQSQCRRDRGDEAACEMERFAESGMLFLPHEGGGIDIGADPDSPRRTVYTDSFSE